jgi:hypothetical protein
MGDWLDGGDEDDRLVGEAGDDYLDDWADDDPNDAAPADVLARESQSPGYGGYAVANDCEWRRAA